VTVATLGEALALGMLVKAWCRRGRADGSRCKSSRECTNQAELDLGLFLFRLRAATPLGD
jgi:hypothetical protein